MNKKTVIISIIFLVLAVGYIKYRRASAPVLPPPVWVQSSLVREEALPQETRAIGTVVARSVQVTPEMAGHVAKIAFKDGALVKQGDVLIQLNDAVYQAQYTSAAAQSSYTDHNYKRMALLAEKGVISRQAIDLSETDMKEKRALMDEAQVALNKMKLVAPFDGVAGQCKVNPGDYVNVGQGVVMVTDTRHLRVEYSVPEKFLSVLKLGQEVKITTNSYPGQVFIGKLAFISPTINVDNRSIALYAEVDNNAARLASGMFVDVTQTIGSDDVAMMIPARSLVPVVEGDQVFKIVEGKAVAVNVQVGRRTLDQVQVIKGLSKNDRVVTDGQLKLKDGAPVKIKS